MKQFFYSTGPLLGRIRILICLLACITFTSTGHAQTFEVDNDHTSLVFAVSHSGLSYIYGRFNKCSGQITLGKTEENQSFIFTVDAGSIDTNNQLRDEYLKGEKFFDVRTFSKIEFRCTKLSSDNGGDLIAQGVIEMHGVKQDITIQLTKIGIGKGTRGETRAGFFSKFSVKRDDFGLRALPKIIGNEIAITLSFEGILKPEKAKQSKPEVESGSQRAVDWQEEFGILEP